MKYNRNKLRNENRTKILIKVFTVAFLFFFFILVYATCVYLKYLKDNQIESPGINEILSSMDMLFSKESFKALNFELIKSSIIFQVTKLWIVYICFFAMILLILTTKVSNDYRGVEHGSATWADKYDEKEFTDNTGIPIGDNFYSTVNNPGKKYYSPHNLNEILIGGSGAGKTFRKIKPDIMQMYGSYVITDPKGELYRDTAKFLKANHYSIRVLNLIDINMSNSYNPFKYMAQEQDVLSVADLFMINTAGEGEKSDFWSGAAQDLLVAIMLYLWKDENEIRSFGRVIRLVNSIAYKDGQIDEICELARCMKKHTIDYPNDAASVNWSSMQGTPQETMGSIAKTLSTRLRLWAVEDVDQLTAVDEMDFDRIGTQKTVIFLIIPAARQTYKAVANIFYSQLFERLMYIANFKYNGRLPMLVSCELDEFANIGKIPNFNETLSVVRSHNIRICIVLQGLSQLKSLYEKTFESVIGNCSLFTYLGTNDLDTKKYVVERLGKTTVRTDTRSHNRGNNGGGSDNESFNSRDLLTVDELPLAIRPKSNTKKYGGNCIVFIDEFRPFFLLKFDTLNHPLIDQVGSSYPKDIHNNTDISEVYGHLKEERKKKYVEQNARMNINNTIDLEKAKKENQKSEDEDQEKLSEIYESDDFSEEISQEFEEKFNEDVNPVLDNFE